MLLSHGYLKEDEIQAMMTFVVKNRALIPTGLTQVETATLLLPKELFRYWFPKIITNAHYRLSNIQIHPSFLFKFPKPIDHAQLFQTVTSHSL